ncbi:glycosyltransferase [Actinoplanes sp. NPDC051851]|uniref:glycosyltransferase n=1 Tax=Actinoplanes sp. NPDC051851 TaxID=3154753 RepID=UPI00342581F1
MRVLLISPFSPAAQHDHAAADTIAKLVPRLAEKTDLFVYSPQNTEESGTYTSLIPTAPFRPGPLARFGARPAWLRQAWPHAATREVRGLIERLKPDVVHAEYLQSAEILASRDNTVLTLHDITESVMAESYRASSGPERAYRLAELVRTRRFERDAMRRAGALMTLSEADHAVASRYNPRTLLARPGVDIGPVSWTAPPAGQPPRLVFAGAMWRRANILAARLLADEVMPLVWERYPTAELRIVGARPAGEITALAERDARVVVTGAVPDLRDEMLAAHAVVVPSVVGGGVLMKVVHAMALGCPVITSPGPADSVGADASMLCSGRTGRELAEAIDATLRHPAEAAARGAQARAHIERTFRWDDTVHAYLDAYAMVSQR